MRRLNAAVIGVGFGRAVHVPALRSIDRCTVAAICASKQSKADEAAAALGVPRAESDWRRLVDDPTIDIVTLALPPALQTEVALAAVAQGKAVFCEKPLAVDLAAAEHLTLAAEAAGVPNVVNFEFPEHPAWLKALELLRAGAIGRLQHVHVRWHVLTYANRLRRESWKTRSADGGGTLGGFVSHVFHYLEQFAGPISRIQSQLRQATDDPRAGETMVQLWVDFADGAFGSISVNADAGPNNVHAIELIGDQGTLELINEGADYLNGFRLLLSLREEPVGMQELVSAAAIPQIDGRIAATAALMNKLVNWRLTGVAAGPAFRHGLRVQQWIAAAQRSAATGRPSELVSSQPDFSAQPERTDA